MPNRTQQSPADVPPAYDALESELMAYLTRCLHLVNQGQADKLPEGVTAASIVSLLRAARQPEETAKKGRAGSDDGEVAAAYKTANLATLKALAKAGMLHPEVAEALGVKGKS